ncbi:MAG: DUF4405 domain-containing protein [Kiritimatiellia bacterium]
MKINRARWITVTDLVSFFSMLSLLFTGIILHFVLPKGSGGGGGPGWRAATRPVKEFWMLTRHEWGAVHFWISMVFVMAILLHLLFHWKWIQVSFFRRKPRKLPTLTAR